MRIDINGSEYRYENAAEIILKFKQIDNENFRITVEADNELIEIRHCANNECFTVTDMMNHLNIYTISKK